MEHKAGELDGGMNAAVEAATVALRQSVRDAYQQGYDAAVRDLKDRIMAVFGPVALSAHVEAVSTVHAKIRRRRPSSGRARHGVAAKAVKDVFTIGTGLSVTELHQQALKLGHQLSIEGIGNELRRFEGKKYRRDERRHWFPLSSAETETAGTVHQDSDPAATH